MIINYTSFGCIDDKQVKIKNNFFERNISIIKNISIIIVYLLFV